MMLFSQDGEELDLEGTLELLESHLSKSVNPAERALYKFFTGDVWPDRAYTDTDVNQDLSEPKKRFVAINTKLY